MWVWRFGRPDDLVAAAVARRITHLFVAVPEGIDSSARLGDYRRLVARAHQSGIPVDALGGDPRWIDEPARVVADWLTPVVRSALFDGVHADVEPHAHPSWNGERERVVARYLALLDAVATRCRDVLALEADIPHWFHEVRAAQSSLDREVLRRLDAVTVLAYRNWAAGADGTVAVAAPAVEAAGQLGRPVRIGQETNDLGPEPEQRKQTFFGRPRAEMERELRAVQTAFAAHPWMAGVAIHDHAGDSAMRHS